jgi:hypothetical protein
MHRNLSQILRSASLTGTFILEMEARTYSKKTHLCFTSACIDLTMESSTLDLVELISVLGRRKAKDLMCLFPSTSQGRLITLEFSTRLPYQSLNSFLLTSS